MVVAALGTVLAAGYLLDASKNSNGTPTDEFKDNPENMLRGMGGSRAPIILPSLGYT